MKVAWLAFASVLIFGCGTDVDLGGSGDAGARDSSTPAIDSGAPQSGDDTCQPCAASSSCKTTSACAQYAGDTYCTPTCNDGGCDPDDTCTSVPTADDAGTVKGCIPASGLCKPAVSPPAPDGGTLTICGNLDGPTIPASCHSCGKFSNDCQANGCYGGYWCDTKTLDCQSPPNPKSCD